MATDDDVTLANRLRFVMSDTPARRTGAPVPTRPPPTAPPRQITQADTSALPQSPAGLATTASARPGRAVSPRWLNKGQGQ
jgi:hypothetical protein